MLHALAFLVREAQKRLGDQAVFNYLPGGSINPDRLTRRGNGEKKRSMYKGKPCKTEVHTALC